MEDFLSQISPQLGRTIGVVAVIGLTAWVVSRGGQRAVERSNPADPERRQRIVTLWTAGRRLIFVVLWLLAVLMVMSIWLIPITPCGGRISVCVGGRIRRPGSSQGCHRGCLDIGRGPV